MLLGFECELTLTPAQLRARIKAHPSVREALDPSAYPPPPVGAPLLLYRDTDEELALRHYAGPMDAMSPSLILTWRASAHGCTVRGELLRSDPAEIAARDGRWTTWALLTVLSACALLPAVLVTLPPQSLALLIAVSLATGLVLVGALSRQDRVPLPQAGRFLKRMLCRPSARQLDAYGPQIWQLLAGEVFSRRLPEQEPERDAYRRLSLPAAES